LNSIILVPIFRYNVLVFHGRFGEKKKTHSRCANDFWILPDLFSTFSFGIPLVKRGMAQNMPDDISTNDCVHRMSSASLRVRQGKTRLIPLGLIILTFVRFERFLQNGFPFDLERERKMV
jgi:hypothetical protein